MSKALIVEEAEVNRENASEVNTSFLNKNIYSKVEQKTGKTKRNHLETINIGLINNAQGGSSVWIELCFRRLLSKSAGETPVQIATFSPLESIEANGLGNYRDLFEQLSNFEPEALIVTGMEPTTPDLRQERLWGVLVKVFEWAEFYGVPTVLSCLAAHAAVLYGDGIVRVPLKEKRFGVFEHHVVAEHWLTQGLQTSFRLPHSRWNELDPSQLKDKGYQILTRSDVAGVDVFIKQRRSLFIHLQGHLEYTAETLCNEYKRDIRRFLAGDRAVYPTLPEGYFTKSDETALDAFRAKCLEERSLELWKFFPIGLRPNELVAPWEQTATIIFQNLLNYTRKVND